MPVRLNFTCNAVTVEWSRIHLDSERLTGRSDRSQREPGRPAKPQREGTSLMDMNPQRRIDDGLGDSPAALRLRGLLPPQGAAMRERDLITMDLTAPALAEPLMRNDDFTAERFFDATEGHEAAQRIVAELVDIEPVKGDDDEADDFLVEE